MTILEIWRDSLKTLLHLYETKRGPLYIFFPLLFLFFIFVNVVCYWWAMYTAFPWLTYGGAGIYYTKVQYPVGFLGALFDSLSFFVTILIIRRAIRSQSTAEYVGHLSIDFVIAVLATFWVLFVFTISGWIINYIDATPQSLAGRSARYEQMAVDALANPTDNLRNIYFGLIMGVSAMIPTCVHISLFLRALFLKVTGSKGNLTESSSA